MEHVSVTLTVSSGYWDPIRTGQATATDTCSTITFISDVMPTGFDPTNAVPATIEFGAAVAI
ncbi:MAG: hypothetical protein AAF492_26400, partial [Verrucomicrobiota bacterium]